MNRSVLCALAAAAMFGASTPFAKMLVGEVSPLLLGGLLYRGSGMGLGIARIIRDRGWTRSGLARHEWPWMLGAVLFGGVLGPVALMFGLMSTSGSTASLLLNLEAVLTALIAWGVFRESADRRVVLGMAAIVAGGVVLSWPTGSTEATNWIGPLAIAAACICWAIDNRSDRSWQSPYWTRHTKCVYAIEAPTSRTPQGQRTGLASKVRMYGCNLYLRAIMN